MSLRQVLGHWRIGEARGVRAIPSHWGKIWAIRTADRSEYILKERGSPRGVEREYRLLRGLSHRGEPVAPPLLAETGRPHALHRGRTYALYSRLPGVAVRAREVGADLDPTVVAGALARLHQDLRACRPSAGFPRLDLAGYVGCQARAIGDELSPALRAAPLQEIGDEVVGVLSALRADLVEQLVHRDLKPSNILLENGRIAGFVDFGTVTHSARLFDPCYFALALLREGWDDAARREAWPRLATGFLGAYGDCLDLTEGERQATFEMLLAVQLTVIGFDLKLRNPEAARRSVEVLEWLYAHRAELGS